MLERLGLTILIAPFTFAATTWVLMLSLGMVHSVVPAVPALGLWDTAIVNLALLFLASVRAFIKGFVEEANK